MLSMAASQKEHLQNHHRSRPTDVSAGDTEFIGSKNPYLNSSRSYLVFGNAVFNIFQ